MGCLEGGFTSTRNGAIAAQHAGQHRDALFREHVDRIPPATPGFDQVEERLAVEPRYALRDLLVSVFLGAEPLAPWREAGLLSRDGAKVAR